MFVPVYLSSRQLAPCSVMRKEARRSRGSGTYRMLRAGWPSRRRANSGPHCRRWRAWPAARSSVHVHRPSRGRPASYKGLLREWGPVQCTPVSQSAQSQPTFIPRPESNETSAEVEGMQWTTGECDNPAQSLRLSHNQLALHRTTTSDDASQHQCILRINYRTAPMQHFHLD